jgi:hypothetical protein
MLEFGVCFHFVSIHHILLESYKPNMLLPMIGVNELMLDLD